MKSSTGIPLQILTKFLIPYNCLKNALITGSLPVSVGALKKKLNNDKLGSNVLTLPSSKVNFTLENNSENNIISNIIGTAKRLSSHKL